MALDDAVRGAEAPHESVGVVDAGDVRLPVVKRRSRGMAVDSGAVGKRGEFIRFQSIHDCMCLLC